MATGRSVVKNLIKYNNNLKENEDEDKESINIELNEQNQTLIMMKMLLNLDDQMYKKKMKKILPWQTSLSSCNSKLIKKIFLKSKK